MKKNGIEFRRGNAGGGNQMRQHYIKSYLKNVNIITNNPLKMSAIKKAGIKIINQINTKPTINKYNKNYFKTRVKKTS